MDIVIKQYTRDQIAEVIEFERRLREEEADWGWEIDDAYREAVEQSFIDPRFEHSLSLIAYHDGRVVGRIDSAIVCSHFDGSTKAYLDWICVLKSCRHMRVAQRLMATLREKLKKVGASTLIAIIAHNEEALRFYHSLENAKIQDEGIWIDL